MRCKHLEASNDNFLSYALKCCFRLSEVRLKLCSIIKAEIKNLSYLGILVGLASCRIYWGCFAHFSGTFGPCHNHNWPYLVLQTTLLSIQPQTNRLKISHITKLNLRGLEAFQTDCDLPKRYVDGVPLNSHSKKYHCQSLTAEAFTGFGCYDKQSPKRPVAELLPSKSKQWGLKNCSQRRLFPKWSIPQCR